MRPWTLLLLAPLASLGCDRSPSPPAATDPPARPAATPSAPTASASAAPTASASAPPAASATAPAASASAAGARNALCDRVLTAMDVKAACHIDSSADPLSGPEDPATAATFTCTRRLTLGDRSLSFVLTRAPDPKTAKQTFEAQTKSRKEEPEYRSLGAFGEGGGRGFVAITLTGDLNHTVELYKNAYLLKIFTPKITSNNRDLAPFCSLDQLKVLAQKAAERL